MLERAATAGTKVLERPMSGGLANGDCGTRFFSDGRGGTADEEISDFDYRSIDDD